MTSRSVLGSLL